MGSAAATAVVGSGPVLGHSDLSSTSSGRMALLAPSPTSTSTSPDKHGLPVATNIAPFIAGSAASGQGAVGQCGDSMAYTMSEAMNYVAPAIPSSSVDTYAMSSSSIEFLLG